jgi:ADP-heptose:LPS heptosyltransferase
MVQIKKTPIVFIKPKTFSLKEFWEKRNQIIIKREVLALGDFLIHRMVFEDCKKTHPEININFACPIKYFDALKDHSFIDNLLDSSMVNIEDYIATYNTSTACTRYESNHGKESTMHRSDIWASQCGVVLKSHNMHFNISDESKTWALKEIFKIKQENKPIVLFCPYSANQTKNITDEQIEIIVNYLKEKNCNIFSIHSNSTSILEKLNIPIFINLKFNNLIALVNCADYVISVDTSFFHCAGGLNRPLMGIFGYTNGKVYGKYYKFELVQKHKDNGNWDCGPCYLSWKCSKIKKKGPFPCIAELTPQMFYDGIDKMFNKHPWKIEKLL